MHSVPLFRDSPIIVILAVSALGTSYPSELWNKAWTDSLDWFGGGGGIAATLIMFGLTFLASWRKEGRTAARQLLVASVKGAGVVVAAWILILVMHLCVLSPAALNTQKQATINSLKEAQTTAPAPIKIDVLDSESRKKIEELEIKLAKTEEELRNTVQAGPSADPLTLPIAAVKFTISLNLKDRKDSGGHEISDGLLIVLTADEKGLLHGTTTEHFEDNSGQRRYFVDIPFDSGQMGEATSTLSDATSIVVQFKELLMPLGTVISDGQIVMVVNNQITVKFDVPGQTIQAKANNNPVIIVQDIQKQMRQVIKPLSSPTPNTAASPPSPTS